MSQAKDKYFEILTREESWVKYNIRANDEEQARRLFEQHSDMYSAQRGTKVVSYDKHIIDIEETKDGQPF